ncbi:MAG: rRNA maturation RNase YbeY [Rhodobacteraceae bacterium]|nr:rRNA maturation RNase YbeY [Paracoccaceae bacterium]
MADNIDVLLEDERWQLTDIGHWAERSFDAVFAERGIGSLAFEVSLLACDDIKIADLNFEFRGKKQPTNVLSWPSFELAPAIPGTDPVPPADPVAPLQEQSLGDIAISYDTCQREAKSGRIRFEDHVCHLLVHSCLHLLGFDHETDADAARMEGIETKILASMGIKDPY